MGINSEDEILDFLPLQKVIYELFFIIDDLLLNQVIHIFSNENQPFTLILQ